MRPSNINGIPLKVPAALAGILPVGSGTLLFPFEPSAFTGIAAVLRPGGIAFDVGASYGVITALMAHIVGPQGRVYAFEANQAPLHKAREFVAANEFTDRVIFIHACVGERSSGDVEFFVAPGFASVASSRNPGISRNLEGVDSTRVASLSLDDYCTQMQVTPECIKLDIEGSEYVALQGAFRTLKRHQPDLIMETHGQEISGIGGSVSELCDVLEGLGYSIFDLEQGALVTPKQYAETYPGRIGYLLASTRLEDRHFVQMLVEERLKELARIEESLRVRQKLDAAREHVNSGRASEAMSLLTDFLRQIPEHAEGNYLMAYCLHSTRTQPEAALEYYHLALECGFDEFWVCYSRGALYLELGDRKSALGDLMRAQELNPSHEGPAAYLEHLLNS